MVFLRQTVAIFSAPLLVSAGATLPTLSISSSLTLSSVLNSIGLSIVNNLPSGGPTVAFHDECPFNIQPVPAQNKTPHYSPPVQCPLPPQNQPIDWTTFKANGANLGSWLAKERTHDPIWWESVSPSTQDEWNLCLDLGSRCGPVLEERYSSFLNTSTIDKLASVGVNTLRIPTSYAAWVKVPGSALYTGSQQAHLYAIAKYAIEVYGMHVIIGLHSLPGGVNNLDIGEALGHDAWFQNATNLDYSFKALKAMVAWIGTTGHPNSFTIYPINEASDNLAGFGTPKGLSDAGVTWIVQYLYGALKIVRDSPFPKIPIMVQDCFKGASFWEPYFKPATDNIVFDSHVYFFAAAGVYAEYVLPAICGEAQYIKDNESKFPVFIGEWSLQTTYNNTYANRKQLFDTQRFAYGKYESGSAFWTAVSYATAAVDGQGEQQDYWCYEKLIDAGVITKTANASYCDN